MYLYKNKITMSQIKVLHDKVLLKKMESEETVSGGIIIPDNGKERSNQYKVVEVGGGMFNPHSSDYYPMFVKVGDVVVVPKAVVIQITLEGEDYYVCREVEILTVIKD